MIPLNLFLASMIFYSRKHWIVGSACLLAFFAAVL